MSNDLEKTPNTAQDLFYALINQEEQYSLWPTALAIPPGWRDAGFEGTQEQCLAHIREVWTDMRPLSARKTR